MLVLRAKTGDLLVFGCELLLELDVVALMILRGELLQGHLISDYCAELFELGLDELIVKAAEVFQRLLELREVLVERLSSHLGDLSGVVSE